MASDSRSVLNSDLPRLNFKIVLVNVEQISLDMEKIYFLGGNMSSKALLFPCYRTVWDFDGQIHNANAAEIDLTDARTWRSARVIEAYDWYKPIKFHGFLVHNEEVRNLLPPGTCTLSDVEKLFHSAKNNELFKAEFDDKGLVIPSTVPENKGESGFVERVLPGAHTTLAWTAASLKMATEDLCNLLLSGEA